MRVVALLALAACGADDDPLVLRFTPDPGAVGAERYQCFGFERTFDADLGGIALVRRDSPVTIHHLSLYASPTAYAAGPVDCLAMPDDAVPMHVWAPGGSDLVLPDDIALMLPPATTWLIVQTHALRTDEGVAVEREVVLSPRRDAVHRAGWMPLRAPTPALRPFYREESSASCTIVSALHLVSTWPHMHRAGVEFHGRIVDGAPIVDVAPWVFDAQHAYPIEIDVAPRQTIETRCIWQNTTDQTILPGPNITDEMCGQSMIAYPAEAAHCS